MFTAAIQELETAQSSVSVPESFTDYCNRTSQVVPKDVASKISVQSFASLDPSLRAANVMVFRLGSPPGTRTTQFGLARTVNGWSDYFFIDNEIFSHKEPVAFIPEASISDLYAFSIFPRFTETTLVNFALASGLLAEALELDQNPSIPVTGRSTYTFTFHPRLPQDTTWIHQSGQVEIDGVFNARRKGSDRLFIVEAKFGELDSLSKNKLFYPYLSIRPHVPDNMPISLVYLRASTANSSIIYNVAESTTPNLDSPSPLDMSIVAARRFTVEMPAAY